MIGPLTRGGGGGWMLGRPVVLVGGLLPAQVEVKGCEEGEREREREDDGCRTMGGRDQICWDQSQYAPGTCNHAKSR